VDVGVVDEDDVEVGLGPAVSLISFSEVINSSLMTVPLGNFFTIVLFG
jgi:hypothetical protein